MRNMKSEGIMQLKPHSSSSPLPPSPISPLSAPPHLFTESELTAAEQLLQLSESSCTAAASGCNSAASASSSTRSVNAPMDDVLEDDEGLWRRNKRYRPIADVYASTVQLDAEEDGKKKEKKKKRKRDERDVYGFSSIDLNM